MSSNSAGKTPIQRTPPNLAGQPAVDLRKNDFDATIWNKGYEAYIDKAINCPCRVKSNNQALSSCKNCGGSGYVYINRYKTKLVLQSMNIETRSKEWSEEKLGTVKVTARTEDELAFMDRITVLKGLMPNSETIHPITINNEVKARLEYAPIEIEEFYTFIDSNQKLRKLEHETDYTIEDNIVTFASEFLAWPDFTVSIRYKHHPAYHVIDLPRGMIETEALDKNDGSRKYTKLPIHAVARLAHYVLDEQNFSKDFLLDNSYSSDCQKNAVVKIPQTVCAPGTIFINQDLYGEIISGGELIIPVKDGDGVSVGTLVNGEWIVPPAADATIENSDQTYQQSTPSGSNLILPDINININGTNEATSPSVKDIILQVLDPSDTQVGTFEAPNIIRVPASGSSGIVYNYPTPPITYASHLAGDAHWRFLNGDFDYPAEEGKRARLVDYFTLAENNIFGNTNRFTDVSGGQDYVLADDNKNMILDHHTRIMWCVPNLGWRNWASAIFEANNATNGGFTNWTLPVFNELATIVYRGSGTGLNYAPFNILANWLNDSSEIRNNIWSCETEESNTQYKGVFYNNGASLSAIGDFFFSRALETDTFRSLYVRMF